MKRPLILLCASLVVILCGCNKNENLRPERDDYIKVYDGTSKKPLDNIQVPFEGAEAGEIHVFTSVDLQWKYFVDQFDDDTEWFIIKSVEEVEPGHIVVVYDAESILDLNSLSRRSGRLSFSCPAQSFGKFLAVSQGYERRFLEEFSYEPDGHLTLTGKKTYTTREFSELSRDYFDYISFNTWADTDNEFLSKNITLDITVSGGQFYDTGLTTFRVNVPLAEAADASNFKTLLLIGNGVQMSSKTTFTFSTANDDQVYVHIDNFAAYKVSEAEFGALFEDEEFEPEEEIDWI